MQRTKVTDPNQRDVFDSGARARSADPDTSKAAAQSVRNIRASHKRILAMFRAYGDMTDETLAEYLAEAAKETGSKLMSPSGVRSRRSELSKPNLDRLAQLRDEYVSAAGLTGTWAEVYDEKLKEKFDSAARHQLRTEGFKSELWDTGKRETLSSGRQAIVWGLAR